MFNRFYNYCNNKSAYISSKSDFYTGLMFIFTGLFAFILGGKITLPLLFLITALIFIFSFPKKTGKNLDSKHEKNKK